MTIRSTATIIAALFAAVAPAAAIAHPRLIAATPAADKTVAPTKTVSLTFSEKLVPKLSSGTLTMTGMPGAASHPAAKLNGVTSAVGPDGKSLILTAAKPLGAGTYRADYAIVSVDTHRVTGTMTFSVK